MNHPVPAHVPKTGNGCMQAAALLWLLARRKKAQKQPSLFHLHLVLQGSLLLLAFSVAIQGIHLRKALPHINLLPLTFLPPPCL